MTNTYHLDGDFSQGRLTKKMLLSEPIDQFKQWFTYASAQGITAPHAMSLATTSSQGEVSLRTVLLKEYDKRGFVFHTNLSSNKARDIDACNSVALLFPWIAIGRQIIVKGKAFPLSAKEADDYFSGRPRGSQIAALASRQSKVLTDRKSLVKKCQSISRQYQGMDIPRPEFWGGYRVAVNTMEFWLSRSDRLHDRFLYQQGAAGWQISRLSP